MNFPQDPKQLDAQSEIRIDKWLEVDSEECRDKDTTYTLTKKMIKLLMGHSLFADFSGRLWGVGPDKKFYPFHFNYGKKIFGYRISTKAVN